ncbi:hypothetical protein QKT49_gp202 [Acanthamoeba castellanii medusavirus]|uniref:Uncharacterized protein n=1 Tax=Acanthamoeba castellanii medusavirus J1 TaxID=3114988 RepID=A0A3T1CXL2_9VIRU|nr:hypothetical protein QKT49_gp202 [Acanthamoeba castellanii medusavirus]BBI30561.1 hypothetical protein [Acanthamoeba castellanii medusavirus J1]
MDFDPNDPLYAELFGEAPSAPAPPAGGLPAELDPAMLVALNEQVFNATRGVYKSRRQKKAAAADDDTADAQPPPPAKSWASKRPAGSGPRQVEASDVTCDGKPGELPGCYYPYSLPDSDQAGERIRWNAVKFNPRNGEEDKAFRELDPIDRVVLHLARARSRLAAALGIWRKTDRQPFKTVTPYQMKIFMIGVVNQMAFGNGEAQGSFDPVESGVIQRAAQTMQDAGLDKPSNDHEFLALPRVASWSERFEELNDEDAIAAWANFLSEDAEGALATGYKWSKHINGRPDVGLFSWRSAEKIAREGAADAKFRTQYSQSWNYLDLAMRHIYEAVRLLALRSAQLAKAGADATDERLRRLAILPGDARLLIFAAHAFPTYLGTPIDTAVPSHQLQFSPVDAISRALGLELREGEEFRTLKVTRIKDEDGKLVLISRPVFALHAISAHLMATSSGKHRTRERDALWKANGGRGVAAYANIIETMLKGGVPANPVYSAFAYSVDLAGYFDPDNAAANAVPEALTKLPTIKPLTQQYDDPSEKQAEETSIAEQLLEEEDEDELGEEQQQAVAELAADLAKETDDQAASIAEQLLEEEDDEEEGGEEQQQAVAELAADLAKEFNTPTEEEEEEEEEAAAAPFEAPSDLAPTFWDWDPEEIRDLEAFFASADV